MTNKSRTIYALRNAFTGASMQVFNVLLGFVNRTVFIYLLNSEYLGVNGLYSNILMVLSFAELGIGSAIVFSLYKPIAEDDKHKIRALMKFYRSAYRIIALTVFVLGLCVVPFLGIIIKEAPDISENLTVIYLFFLANTSISYLLSYKKTLITANQKEYVVQIYTSAFQMFKLVMEIVVLLITHNYMAYLCVQLVSTIALNLSLSIKADKLYPYIKEENKDNLSKSERNSIFSNVKALFIYKLGSVVLNGTDNILISSLINISSVGLASNYTMLINSTSNIIGQAINSITASVGNLSVKGTKDQIRLVMNELLLLCVWLYGFIVIGFGTLANDFVYLWLGADYCLNQAVVLSILFSLYINGVQYAAYILRTTQGLFNQSRWIPMCSAVINVVLSIWWGKLYGMAGIFFATGVSRLLTTTIVDPWLVYKNNFSSKPYRYYLRYLIYALAVIINLTIHLLIIPMIHINGWMGFVVKFLIVCVSANLIFYLEFSWTKEFKDLKNRVLLMIRRKKN